MLGFGLWGFGDDVALRSLVLVVSVAIGTPLILLISCVYAQSADGLYFIAGT